VRREPASVPFSLLFLFLPSTAGALACLAPAAFLVGAGVPGMHVTAQTLAPPRLRALASALNLLVLSLVGLGLGPTIVGILNDALAPEFGERAIRYSLALVALSSLWSAAHNELSARAIPDALRQARS
jgi:MFS family permease